VIDNAKFFQDLVGRLVLTPVTLRRVFVLLTRLHYSDPANYGEFSKRFENFIWSADPKIRQLHIDYDYNYNPAAIDRRPAIYVGTDDLEYRKTVLDNHNQCTPDRSGELKNKVAVTKIIIRHIGATADETLAMADLSAQFFMGIGSMMKDALGQRLMEYEVVGVKSSRPFEKSGEQADQNFIADLLISFAYNAVWLIKYESHRIKTITLEQSIAELGNPRYSEGTTQ
jgi:hypothetical protein